MVLHLEVFKYVFWVYLVNIYEKTYFCNVFPFLTLNFITLIKYYGSLA